eukprot:TRINITY_DN11826_c0_g1_i2.p1 TRINITY_DN11826_c0_g1~~TRINITY_DN11826_c0_g1_i2.p1  ORF type:complete len:302 (+),score=68.56 TRINITY_DN11826_c0_g1_i2:93-998(+)
MSKTFEEKDNLGEFKRLVESKEEIESEIYQNLIESLIFENKAEECYEVSIEENNVQVVELLIKNKIDVNTNIGKHRWTPLNIAAMELHNDIIKLLIYNKADINKSDNEFGYAPLLNAVYNTCDDDSTETIELILKLKGDINKPENLDGETPLIMSIFYEKTKVIRLLVENKVDVNKANEEGQSPLHAITVKNCEDNIEIIELLIESNSDINITDNEGNTALHNSVDIRNKEILKLLIKNGADINKKNNRGEIADIESILTKDEINNLLYNNYKDQLNDTVKKKGNEEKNEDKGKNNNNNIN